MLRIKICGITREEDALAAVRYGADALGFNFYSESPRRIKPDRAAEICAQLPPFITKVGVFVDEPPEAVQKVFNRVRLDAVQLHGSEQPSTMAQYPGKVIKAIRVRDAGSLDDLSRFKVSAYLLDTYKKGTPGGTGETFNWDLAVGAKQHGPIILSGGLNPSNVIDAARVVKPYAVDVASGVEIEPGIKDHGRMKLLITRCRQALSE
jgi:phosphoribosylanthranilate isomerase